MSTGEQTRPYGPVMMLVVGFDRSHFKGEILPELRRLSDEGVIRILDLMVVAKHENGDLEALQESDLTTEEAQELGAIIGALVGFGHGGEEEAYSAAIAGAAEGEDGHILPDAEVWYLGDAIPDGTTAAIALIEHRWAIPLRDKILAEGGVPIAAEWIHPADLVAIGLKAAEKDATGAKA
jgi:uncharacterized membrane protein